MKFSITRVCVSSARDTFSNNGKDSFASEIRLSWISTIFLNVHTSAPMRQIVKNAQAPCVSMNLDADHKSGMGSPRHRRVKATRLTVQNASVPAVVPAFSQQFVWEKQTLDHITPLHGPSSLSQRRTVLFMTTRPLIPIMGSSGQRRCRKDADSKQKCSHGFHPHFAAP